jgi:hypothetical protein
LRGLGDSFGFLFDGMQLQRRAGMTVPTGQAHLAGLIEQTQELGVEFESVDPDQGTDGGAAGPAIDQAGHDGSSGRPQRAVASRTEPQLGLHRLRACGQLLEVHDPELWLTRDGGDRGGSYPRQNAGCCRGEQRADRT